LLIFFSFTEAGPLAYSDSELILVGLSGQGIAQHKGRHTSMPRAEFESTIPVFERSETICVLDRAATGLSTNLF